MFVYVYVHVYCICMYVYVYIYIYIYIHMYTCIGAEAETAAGELRGPGAEPRDEAGRVAAGRDGQRKVADYILSTVYTYVCMYIYIYIYICTCISIYTYVYTYVYIYRKVAHGYAGKLVGGPAAERYGQTSCVAGGRDGQRKLARGHTYIHTSSSPRAAAEPLGQTGRVAERAGQRKVGEQVARRQQDAAVAERAAEAGAAAADEPAEAGGSVTERPVWRQVSV